MARQQIGITPVNRLPELPRGGSLSCRVTTPSSLAPLSIIRAFSQISASGQYLNFTQRRLQAPDHRRFLPGQARRLTAAVGRRTPTPARRYRRPHECLIDMGEGLLEDPRLHAGAPGPRSPCRQLGRFEIPHSSRRSAKWGHDVHLGSQEQNSRTSDRLCQWQRGARKAIPQR